MEYTVLRSFRWKGKNLKRNDTVEPTTLDETSRCNMLAEMGLVSPNIESDLLAKLQALNVQTGRAMPIVTEVIAGGGEVEKNKRSAKA